MPETKTLKITVPSAPPRKMVLDVRERPSLKFWIILSFQHVFAMFGATVLTPLLINLTADPTGQTKVIGVDVALFASGVGTLVYIAITRAKVPIYLGSSVAYIGTMGALYPLYGNSMFLGLLGIGLVYCLVAILVYLFGTGWIKKMLPPVVVGPMIIVIGLSLAPIAINHIFLLDSKQGNIFENGNWNIDWWGVGVALITIASAMLIVLLCRGKLKLVPIASAMLIGLVVSLVVSTWHKTPEFTKYYQVNWTNISTYVGLPDFSNALLNGQVIGKNQSYSPMPLLIMMPMALATIAEHIGDHTVLGKITGRDYLGDQPGLHKTLLGDGLATMVGGALGGPANTSYGENTTVVGLSRVASVYVTALAAVMAVGMSFVSVISTVLHLIPTHVLGGLELILFGFIGTNGLKVLLDEKVDLHQARNIFVVSIMLVVGLGRAILGWNLNQVAIVFSPTSVAIFAGISANFLLPKERKINLDKMSIAAQSRSRTGSPPD
ncbi:solute carrier family 23 protein [Mycoplasma sp. ATU-Cv-508]|uniref:solute carrier family 23 protein n=1 Tax=Mycoplasma sp. ATU-Cv-508 TaxID=2048001 RepID=UPI000FDDB784